MRFVKFKVVSDDESGSFGVLPNIFQNWPNYSPSIAVSNLGHDLVEHGTRETGAFHQEVAATGSYLFTRLLSGNVSVPRNLWANYASSNKASEWKVSTIDYLPPAPKVLILDKETNDMLDSFIAKMKPELEKEWISEYDTWNMAPDEKIPPCPYTTAEVWPDMVGWLKFGYARASQRYKGNSWIAYMLYKNIEKTIFDNWNRLEQYGGTEQEFTLALDKESGQVELRGPRWW